ncbi:non-canonical purine NTP diphosphatase [Dysgonomonas sp. 511]|uniref:non-canonical purine NTP diphosphatase n=1 Tax=Dysgonomonas sp. 511 TaxID=2302930 RepID=UPI0013CF7A61|nr:non-canonical purine NTP diphosphatase [Dysgonomonas sp. 511]NDV77821.1 non-canonical purine NTP diphosphatase [Dysgonomonas sp. 511]
MKPQLVFATNNAHKLEEVRNVVGDSFQILSLKDIGCTEDIAETGTTLQENALIKAGYIKEKYGFDCFGDDTGLEVDALNGAPGVYSARYAGDGHDAKANMKKLLHEMQGVENRKARFRTVIALVLTGGGHLFEGKIEGRIIEEEKGSAGFGYDPVFMPDGYDQTFAELGNDIKNQVSHRALAVKKLCEFLAKL